MDFDGRSFVSLGGEFGLAGQLQPDPFLAPAYLVRGGVFPDFIGQRFQLVLALALAGFSVWIVLVERSLASCLKPSVECRPGDEKLAFHREFPI